MLTLPFRIGVTHFVGIGGIGMSGIAEVMHISGYRVQGSDVAENANVRRLMELGIPISLGHKPQNIGDAEVVVASSSIGPDNPEILEARARLIPVLGRAEMLAELMRLKWCLAVAGTHGKTTTTSMIAAMLDLASLNPTVINGGIINAYGSNARLGKGDWMVVEADESDGTFVKLPVTIGVCTNLDPEHLDYYGDFNNLKRAFQTFMSRVPFYGFVVACLDDLDVQAIVGRIADRKIITYGLNPQADVRASVISVSDGRSHFDVSISGRVRGGERIIRNCELPMLGEHNVCNALAAVAVGNEMGISDATVKSALAWFTGVRRRFTCTGEWKGITIIDDYGHHPTEIRAVLKAARAATKGKILAVVQPHRYTRVRDLFNEFCTCFNDADTVVVSEIYPAGEKPIKGIDRDSLVHGLRQHGHRHVIPLGSPETLAEIVKASSHSGDYVVCLGAGTITNWANALPNDLAMVTHKEGKVS